MGVRISLPLVGTFSDLISNSIFLLKEVIASLMGLLAWLPIENRTAFPGLLLWHFRCWLQNQKRKTAAKKQHNLEEHKRRNNSDKKLW